jgi:hypothetical protein
MDPYLEQHWQDVHARLILYACDELESQLPSNLIARVEERVVFETEEAAERWIYPDVKIVKQPLAASAPAPAASRSVLVEPTIVEFRSEPATETFINILDAGNGNRLVTVIEILSLANKLPGKGQRLYRRKQAELCASGVSLVEIDLLRRGRRVLTLPIARIPARVRTTYQVCVRRGWKPDSYEIYPVPLRSPLPTIRIPLRKKDEDIRLNLQAVLDLAYRKGRYFTTINYQEPPDPPLRAEDARWAKGLVHKARKA